MKTATFTNWLRNLGALRWMLIVAVIVVITLAPTPGTPASYSGWLLVRTVLAPVLAPLLAMVLLLDALMARVFMAELEGAPRRRLRGIVLLNLLLTGVLVLYWVPYYSALRP
ncbi:MAG: hypothetical protein ACLGHO_08220 [Gammaproteobacteria bacterium]